MTPNPSKLLPVTENVRNASRILWEISKSPVPSVLSIRDICSKLDWIAGQVEYIEKQLQKINGEK